MAPASLLVARLRVCSSWATSSCMIRVSQHLCCVRPFSSSAQPILEPDPAGPPPTQPLPSEHKTGLSARMSFVFDQIDAMERMRGAKDDALERIRAWRQAKKRQDQGDDGSDCKADSMGILASGRAVNEAVGKREYVPAEEGMDLFKKEIELIHPWPEWIELMERLLKQNYFDHRRFDEDQMVKNLPIELPAIADDVGFDFTRDWNTVRTACLNFGRDRFDILRSLSKKDLQILVGYGCPSTDRKVVFSAKLLRKHAHLDEGDVCSSCKLRSTCSNGFLLTQKEEEARTIDVMRILLTFGFDPINSLVENKSLLETKTIKLTVRKLLHDVARLSAVPIDPNLPPPVIKKPPPKVKQPPPPPKRRVGRDDVEMKKGDWLCPKCDFMNFAKNNVCLQCDAKRPKRQLLPGEWECPQCNFLNYRRNMACFRCEHRRPPDEFTGEETQSQHPGPRPPRLDKLAGLSSQAWNFDFDDNESDGADVAAFEFADPPRPSGTPLDLRGVDYAPPDAPRPRAGFNDFDDEDDDVDSYEIDDRSNSERIHKLGTSRAFANQDDHDLNDDDDSDDDDVDVDDDDDNYDQEGPRERSFKEKGRSAFNPGDRTPRASNFSSDQRRDLGRNSGRGTERRGRSFVSDGSDSEGFSSSRPWMNQPPQAGRSRAVGLNQLDNDDDTYDDDDDNDDRAHHGAGRGRNVGMTEGWRRERLDNRTNNRPRSDQMEYRRGGRVNQAEERSRGYDDQMEHRKGGRGNQAKERSRGYNDRMEDRKGGRGNQAEERSRGYNDWMVDRKRGRGNQAEERSRGGYNYRGHSGRSDHRTGGSRNHGELPRRGGSNQWASGGRDFR